MFKNKANNQFPNRRFKGRRSFGSKNKGGKLTTPKKGPSECTVKALLDYCFGCSGYNEADRYLSKKRTISNTWG